jgi:hypothetical protein
MGSNRGIFSRFHGAQGRIGMRLGQRWRLGALFMGGAGSSARTRRLRGVTGCCHLPAFVSTASAAESFRSRCGSVRGAPVCSSQTSPIAAPQVLQGTDNICLKVSSLVFTIPWCNDPQSKNAQYCSNFSTFSLAAGFNGSARDFCQL